MKHACTLTAHTHSACYIKLLYYLANNCSSASGCNRGYIAFTAEEWGWEIITSSKRKWVTCFPSQKWLVKWNSACLYPIGHCWWDRRSIDVSKLFLLCDSRPSLIFTWPFKLTSRHDREPRIKIILYCRSIHSCRYSVMCVVNMSPFYHNAPIRPLLHALSDIYIYTYTIWSDA